MEKNNLFTKILVIAGNVFIWTPIILPFIFAIFSLAQQGIVVLDFLIPAELFPFELIGTLFLIIVGIRIKKYRLHVILFGILSFCFLVTGQLIANFTGLADGGQDYRSIVWYVAVSFIILYDLGIIVVGFNGLRLLRALIRDFNLQQKVVTITHGDGGKYRGTDDKGNEGSSL